MPNYTLALDPFTQVSLVGSNHHAEGRQVSVVTLPLAPLHEMVHLSVGRQVAGWVDPRRVTVVAIVEPPAAAPRPLRTAATYRVILMVKFTGDLQLVYILQVYTLLINLQKLS